MPQAEGGLLPIEAATAERSAPFQEPKCAGLELPHEQPDPIAPPEGELSRSDCGGGSQPRQPGPPNGLPLCLRQLPLGGSDFRVSTSRAFLHRPTHSDHHSPTPVLPSH